MIRLLATTFLFLALCQGAYGFRFFTPIPFARALGWGLTSPERQNGSGICSAAAAERPSPLRDADLRVRLRNATDLDIVWPTLFTAGRGGENRVRSGFLHNVHPGDDVLIWQDGAGTLSRMTVDMGLALFEFDDLSTLSGRGEADLRLTCGAGAADPRLEIIENGRVEGVIAGRSRSPLDPAFSYSTSFADLIADDGAALWEARGGYPETFDETPAIAVAFAGATWIGRVVPLYWEDERKESGEGSGPEIDAVILQAAYSEQRVGDAIAALRALGLRPWRVLATGGGGELLSDEIVAGDADGKRTAALLAAGKPGTGPGGVAALLLTERTLEEAARGGGVSRMPAVFVELSGSRMMEVRYFGDCRTLVALSGKASENPGE